MRVNLTLICMFLCVRAFAQLHMIETKDLRLVTYDFGHKFILPHAIRSYHNALSFHKPLFDYQPSEKITVLIQDFGDFGNGGATAIPVNAVSMGLSPFSYTFETSPAGERVFSLMNHELVHVIALDNASSRDRFYHKLFFGKVLPSKENPISAYYSFLTSPRRYSPRWYHEGIASYLETWMSGGVGLAMGSYDEMIFRTRILEDTRIYTAQGLEAEGTTTDFQGKTNSYLYGTRFMGYLSYTYGPDKIIEWVKRKDGSKRSYSAQFKHVYGKPMTEGWDDWIAFERDWQKENIQNLHEFELSSYDIITQKTLGSVSYPYFDAKRNKVYLAVNYPGVVPHLAALNLHNGKMEKLTDIKGAALFYVSSVTFDEESDIIYFTTDNDAWRDLNSFNIKTGKTKRLQRDFRTGDLAFNKTDKSIWGIKHLNGFSTIVRIPPQDPDDNSAQAYSTWQQKYTLPYGQDIFDIDISPDGKKLSAAVSDFSGNQSLLIYDIESLMNNKAVADTVFNFEVSSPQSFRFTKDGKYMYGVSYYSGVSNIYRVDVNTFDIEPISNVLSGIFRPIEIDDERLLAFIFTSEGFKPVYTSNKPIENIASIEFLGNKTIEKHPLLKDWELSIAKANEIDVESIKINEGPYRPGKLLNLNSAYPIVVGYKNFIGIGMTANIGDPLGLRTMDISFSVTPRAWRNGFASEGDPTNLELDKDEQYHAAFFGRFGQFTVNATYNNADFYDIFGPTRYSRKGFMAKTDFTRSLIWDMPRKLDLTVGLGGFYGLEKSPFFQQIETQGFDNNLFVNFDGTIAYSFLKNSLGAVDPEKGIRTSMRTISAYSAGDFYTSLIGSLDLGFQLPVDHLSLWIRTSAGSSFSQTLNPFTRFGFAAFGNNNIDYMAARRYRNIFSFPGLGFEAESNIIAKDFLKTMVEFVLPPVRFRNLGGLNFYSNWAQATIFSSGIISEDPSTRNNRFVNIGSQVDMKIVIFSLLESTLSFGYASAFDLNNNNQRFDEFMISLKLLR